MISRIAPAFLTIFLGFLCLPAQSAVQTSAGAPVAQSTTSADADTSTGTSDGKVRTKSNQTNERAMSEAKAPDGGVPLSRGAAGNGADARQLLIQTDRNWEKVASQGKDVEKVVAYWADDAMIVPDGAPIVSGKTAIREFVKQSFATPGFKISWKTIDASVSQDGTMGYTTADSSLTFPGPDGKLKTQRARGVTIWRRTSGGDWKCVYDAWNQGPESGA